MGIPLDYGNYDKVEQQALKYCINWSWEIYTPYAGGAKYTWKVHNGKI
jgi:hypothetical protein